MKKYKVLWIDDQWQSLISFKELCEEVNDMEVVPCQFAEEGMLIYESALQEWAAVILDAKMLLRSVNEVTKLDGLRYCRDRMNELKHKRDVPSFIFTGQPDLLSNELFEESFGSFYKKGKDSMRLISDIKKAADELLETQIFNKYRDVFDCWPDRRAEITNILKVLETGDNRNASCLNEIRKMLDDVMDRVDKSGLLLIEWNKTNLSECSRFLGHSWMREELGVPCHVQRAIHSAVEISNPGSHRSDLEESVKSGKAPYLVPSVIYDLLNILYWCKNLPDSSEHDNVQKLVWQIQQSHSHVANQGTGSDITNTTEN